MNIQTNTLAVLCICIALLGLACADASAGRGQNGTPQPNNNGTPDVPDPNNDVPDRLPDPIDPVTPGPRPVPPGPETGYQPPFDNRDVLTIVGNDTRFLNYINAVDLEVVLSDYEGNPVRGGTVTFAIEGEAADLQLGGGEVPTNRNGEARTSLVTGRVSGVYRIVVSSDRAEPVAFEIHVAPKDRAAYVVHTEYDGQVQPTLVSVRLFDASVTCDDLDPMALPAELDRFDVIPTLDGVPDARFVDLPNGVGYTAISLGLIPGEARAAYGCNDEAPPINDGFDTEVTVVMAEILPRLSGVFDIETRVDLTDALPEPWRTNLNIVGQIFSEPEVFLINQLLGDENDPNDDGLLGDVLGFIPGLRGLLEQVVRDLLQQVLPPEVQRVFNIGGTVYQTLTQFTLGGQLEFVREPDAQGFLATHNEHRYGSITINWDIDCDVNDPPECGDIVLSMNRLNEVGALNGQFGGVLVREGEGGDRLLIDRHAFAFNYGALALALFEQIVLPAIFGDGVDSLGAALAEMIDCREISDDVFDPVNDQLLNELLFNGCSEVLSEMEGLLVDLILSGEVDVPALTIGTFEAQNDAEIEAYGCLMQEPEVYADGVIEREYTTMGSADARCLWDARLEAGNETRLIDGDVYGWR